MPQMGYYTGGEQYVISPVRCTAITPTATTELSTVDATPLNIHGTMINEGLNGTGLPAYPGFGPREQGLDQRVRDTSLPMGYSAAMDVDPARNGPIEFLAGEEGTLVKGVSTTFDTRRNLLSLRAVCHVVASAPPTGAYPPAICNPVKTSRHVSSDFDAAFAALPSLSPAFTVPTASNVMNKWRWAKQLQTTMRPNGDRITSGLHEPYYARDSAKDAIEAMLLLTFNIDPVIKRAIFDWLIIHAENTVQMLELGWRYNYPQSVGAVHNGRKMIVVMAALLTGDALFTSWAQRNDWATEDAYVQYVPPEYVAQYGFDAADVGAPWWLSGPLYYGTNYPPNPAYSYSAYQDMYCVHMIGVHALAGILPGFKAMWNNQVQWDFLDRITNRNWFADPGRTRNYFAWGYKNGGTNNASPFCVNMSQTYGPAPVWDWPA